MSLSPFDFLSSICDTKVSLIVDDITEKAYNPWMVNRGLSYFTDTVLIANEMNLLPHLDKKLQESFFINIIRKRKRFSKWNKRDIESDIEAVKTFYGYSTQKAQQILTFLSPDQLEQIKTRVNSGGLRRK